MLRYFFWNNPPHISEFLRTKLRDAISYMGIKHPLHSLFSTFPLKTTFPMYLQQLEMVNTESLGIAGNYNRHLWIFNKVTIDRYQISHNHNSKNIDNAYEVLKWIVA